MDAAKYKHVILGLIFLKYILDPFEEQRTKLKAEFARVDSLPTNTGRESRPWHKKNSFCEGAFYFEKISRSASVIWTYLRNRISTPDYEP